MLKGVNSERPNAITLLYQTGYLTIKDYDPQFRRYGLGYPNKEVEDSFVESLSEFYTPIEKVPANCQQTNSSRISVQATSRC